MKAVILAGGEGTRLHPLTLRLPKPTAPIVDRPLLQHQLDMLERAGVGGGDGLLERFGAALEHAMAARREELRERGLARAAAYTWDESARRHDDVYRAALANHAPV
jgi:CTP:molybdopterin cytidylyltransferase MocA